MVTKRSHILKLCVTILLPTGIKGLTLETYYLNKCKTKGAKINNTHFWENIDASLQEIPELEQKHLHLIFFSTNNLL